MARIFITGASQGLGRATAAELIAPVRLHLLRELRDCRATMLRSLGDRVLANKQELQRIRTSTLADYPQRRLEHRWIEARGRELREARAGRRRAAR